MYKNVHLHKNMYKNFKDNFGLYGIYIIRKELIL